MPKLVKEVTSGVQYDFSSEEGAIAVSTTRVFKVLKSSTGEYINISQTCGVSVGDEHPSEQGLYCVSYSAQYDGDSRMAIVATFNYRTTPSSAASEGGGDPKQSSPDIRPSNISFSTTLTEAPAYVWKPLGGAASAQIGGGDAWQPPVNPAGDRYEGVSTLVPVTTITVTQFEPADPARFSQYAGYINENALTFGSLSMAMHTVMFRGLSLQPTIEHWGGAVYRGWNASYEFLYKPNKTWISGTEIFGVTISDEIEIGWDVAQPLSGTNIINRSYASKAAAEAAGVEAGSLALKRKEASDIGYEIDGWPGNISLAEGTANTKVRGMILVGEGAKPTQRPCAQPIPLNQNGAPRWSGSSPPVLIYRYQTQPEIDFSIFGLRLQ